MATELEIRVTAELSAIKASLATLTQDITKVNTTVSKGGAAAGGMASNLDKASKAAKSTSTATTKLAADANKAKTSMIGLFAGIGGLVVLKGLIQMADTATLLRGQLTLATKSTEEFNRAQTETFNIAQRTRQSLDATVSLYASIARAGATTQSQTLALTETINKAVTLSFTSAQSGAAALFQLGQAMSIGTLRGQDLNSVMSQTPRLALAIGEGLVKIGVLTKATDLRAYAEKNGIAVGLVVKALEVMGTTIDTEFKKIPPTVGGAMTALRNAVLKFVGDTDSANGASRKLADTILLVSKNIDTLAAGLILGAKLWLAYKIAIVWVPGVVGAIAAAFTAAGAASAIAAPEIASTGAAGVTAGAGLTTGAAGAAIFTTNITLAGARAATFGTLIKVGIIGALGVVTSFVAGWQIGTALKEKFLGVELAGIALAAGLTKVAKTIANGFVAVGTVIKATFVEAFNFVVGKAADMFESIAKAEAKIPGIGAKLAGVNNQRAAALRASMGPETSVTATIAAIRAKQKADMKAIDDGFGDLADAAIAARQKVGEVTNPPGGGGDEGNGGTAAKGVKAIIDQYALLKDAADRALASLEKLYADAGIATDAYYKQKIALQQKSIDADIGSARVELAAARAAAAKAATAASTAAGAGNTSEASSGKAVGDILTKIIILQRQRAQVAIDGARDQGKAEEDLQTQLEAVRARLMDLQGDKAGARLSGLRAQYKGLTDRLTADSNTAGLAMMHKLFNLEAAKSALDDIKDHYSSVTSALSQLQQTTSAQVSAGLLSNATAEKRMSEARANALTQLQQQRDAVAALYNEYQRPEALQQLQQIDEQIAQLSISTEDWRGKTQDAATGALTTFFTDLTTRAKTAGEAVRDLAINFAQAMAQMAAQALAKKAIGAVMDMFSGGGKKDDAGAGIANAAAQGIAYAAPVTTAAFAMTAAGATLVSGGAAVASAAVALQSAATTLLIANAASSASMAHTGGIVGSLPTGTRMVSPSMFIGAPRYRTGGIAGLAPDEVPTILHRGEEVLRTDNPRHRKNGGGAGQGGQSDAGIRMVLVDDKRRVADYLESAEGERVIVRTMQRNKLSTRS